MADTTLTLGDFTFADFEVPESIPFGGEQMLAVKKLVGGARVIDAMGADDMALDWGGRLRGPSALNRALYLDGLRRAGKPLKLTWSALAYTVIVKRFSCTFERSYELPYTISCEVVSDDTTPIVTISAVTVDDQVSADVATATSYGARIGDPTLTSTLVSLAAAVSAVSSFVGATEDELLSVAIPISAAQLRAAALITAENATISTGATFCGVAAGGEPDALAASLSGYSAAMTALASLYGLSAILTRMSVNLQADGASGGVLTQAGGNLYAIAAEAYGDPAEWTSLAEANNLSDPLLTGINQIRIPVQPDGAGGVWQ